MNASVLIVLLVIIFLVFFWYMNSRCNNFREGLGGGGFSAVSALAYYNSPHHCWQGLYDDGIYCATNSKLML